MDATHGTLRKRGADLQPGAAKPTATRCVHSLDFVPLGSVDADEDALGDTLASANAYRSLSKVVDLTQNLIAITAVILVDNTDSVRH